MKCVALVVLLFVCSVFALSEQQYQNHFLVWTKEHGKVYSSVEFSNRYSIFKANLDYVNEWNSKNAETILGTTVFADLTNEEYKAMLLGTRFDGTDRLAKAKTSKVVTASVSAPASVDWVQKGAVTAVKNQGQCGSCWSFSTTGSVEGAHFLSAGNLVALSEQNLMDCSWSYGNNGCNGGLMDNAFKYVISNGGLDTEQSYPYTAASSHKCGYKDANSAAKITGYSDVTAGSETALQTAASSQPISVAIDASHQSFQLYSSGVYYEPQCSTSQLDHGVLVVGFGTLGSSDYWTVKNSWGTTWGQKGYIFMARNRSNACGIATMASFPTIKK